MSATSVEVDRPLEAEGGAGNVVERRLGADLVEVDSQGLGRIKRAYHPLPDHPRKAALPVSLYVLLFPAHEHMFAPHPDATAPKGGFSVQAPSMFPA